MSKLISRQDQAFADWLLDDSPATLASYTGAEQGFNQAADVVRAADGTDLSQFWQEVLDTIQMRNENRNTLLDELTTDISGISEVINPPTEVEFEEASEFGQPVGMKATSTRFFRGYDFKFYDLAVRYTWMFIAEADQGQLRLNHNVALEADLKIRFRKVMQRLFNPLNSVGGGFTEKNEPVTVFAAYNGDGEVPPAYEHSTFLGSHNHYTTSGAAAIRPQDLDALALNIQEHGYTLAKGYRLIVLLNRQEAAIVKTFRVLTGAAYDFVPNPALQNGAVWVPNNGSYVGGPTGTVRGQIGTYGPFHVVEEGYIPAGYAVGIVTGGPGNLGNPVGFRQHSNPAYRGLKIIPGQRSDYPLLDSFYRRGFGTGIRHRGGLAIMQITANPTYTVPAAFDASIG